MAIATHAAGLSRVGGLLLAMGSALAAVSLVVGSPDAFGNVLLPLLPTAFVVLLGAGATAATVAGRGVFGAQRARAVLGLTAAGLLALGLGSIMSLVGLLGTGDPMSNPGIVVGLVGTAVTFVGAILAGLLLIAMTGIPRLVGLALSAGMPCLLIGTLFRSFSFGAILGPAGSILLISGFAGLGFLALSGPADRTTP